METPFETFIIWLVTILCGGLFIGVVWVLSLLTIDSFFGITCKEKYTISTYSFWGGCKVPYNGEYIPEELYKKAFETNLNVGLYSK